MEASIPGPGNRTGGADPVGREMARGNQDVLEKFGIEAYAGSRKVDPKKIKWNSAQPYQLSYRQQPGEDELLAVAGIMGLDHIVV